MSQLTLGVIIGNRGFFPNHLCKEGRENILKVLKKHNITAILPPENATSFAGAVETLNDAKVCGDLFKKNADKIDGILVTLPNFGDERAIANTIRWSGLKVPVLVQATPDNNKKMTISDRRDSFCGKMSACNNLIQYGIPFSLTGLHCVDPSSAAFDRDLASFASTCKVVKSLKNARFGMIGARPAAFNTVRFSEKLLERSGITIETLDLMEVMGWIRNTKDNDGAVKDKIAAIKAYTNVKGVPAESLLKMAKLGVVIDKWSKDNAIDATAIQCWTAIEEFYGTVPCTIMSMLSNSLRASACETDIGGLIGMHAMVAASGTPSALLDWNNNYGNDPDKGVVFHCSNLPKAFFETHKMDYQAIIAGTVGKNNTYGTIAGRIKAGPFTYCRLSTDDYKGKIMGYVGEGRMTKDKLGTFGGYGVFEIPNLQKLLRHICENAFEHHVALNLSQVAGAVNEAMSKYLGWDMYYHKG